LGQINAQSSEGESSTAVVVQQSRSDLAGASSADAVIVSSREKQRAQGERLSGADGGRLACGVGGDFKRVRRGTTASGNGGAALQCVVDVGGHRATGVVGWIVAGVGDHIV